ncbi:hypothetical protein ACFLWZ_01775 [Chloroflexota bacterium]
MNRPALASVLPFLVTSLLIIGASSLQLVSPATASESSPWVQTNGPFGGIINTIEIDPLQPNTLYSGGTGGCVFKTTNGGVAWKMLQQIVEPENNIMDILVSPDEPQTIYAQTNLLHKSINGGQSWRELNISKLKCIVMSRENSLVMIAGKNDGGVYRSADSGEGWTDISGNLPGDSIADIAIGASDEYWVGTANRSNGHLYHTTNGGISWEMVNFGQGANTDIHTIFVDPDNTNTVYVSLMDVHNEMFDPNEDDYLFKTEDGGVTWTSLRLPNTDAMINIMGRAPSDDYLYVASGGNYFFRSADGGHVWENIEVPGPNGDMYDIAVDPQDSRLLYLPRRAYGIIKSTDRGINWSLINDGLLNVTVNLLAVTNVQGSGTVYATTHGGEGTFKTVDFGNSWENVNEGGITHPWADEIVVNPQDPETVWYVSDTAEVFKTTDGGATWHRIINPRPGGQGFRFGSVTAIAPAPSDSGITYALKSGFGIFKMSAEAPGSWRFLHQSEVDYTYSIAVHPHNPDIIISGYNPKPFQDWAMVRRSIDGGDSWETVLTIPGSDGVTSVVFDLNDPRTVYTASIGASGGSIFKSTDGGSSWSNLNEYFTMCTVWGQPQLIIDPTNPQVAYVGTWLAGTWKTTDAGANWTLLEEAPTSATALSVNSKDSNIVYLADRTAPKIWKTSDCGTHWEEIADFSNDRAFLLNRVLADGDTVYASTFGPGLHGGKLYKSTDAGSTWSDITGILPRSVLDVAVDPSNPGIVYVTTHIFGAYKSSDGGANWIKMEKFPDIGGYDIEVDPVDPTIIYTCGLSGSVPDWCLEPNGYTFTDDAGVYKSTDSGSTWNHILTTSNECRAIRLHPDNNNVLLAAAMDDGLLISTDAGYSWISHNTGLDTQVLTSCAVAGDKVYVGTQSFGVYSGNINPGEWSVTWQSERSNKPVPAVYSLQIEVDPENSSRIFVGSNPGGLYRSDDGGATFYDKNFLTPSVVVDDPLRQGYYTFALNPSDTSEVWLGTWGKGIYKSYDGMDFNITANGTDMKMYGKHIYQIIIDPENPTVVYAASEEGISRTTDGGNTWSDFSTGLETSQIRTLAITADRVLLCGTLGYEIYYYDEQDSRWQQMPAFGNFGTFWPIWNDRPFYQYTSLLLHPTDSEKIYLGTFPAGIYKSVDAGQSWQESNVGWTNDGVFTLLFHPENPEIIYAGTYNGVNRSIDSGTHWETWGDGWSAEQWVFSIDFDPQNPDIMYACSKNGENEGTGREGFHGTVMKSINGGEQWFPITTGLDIEQEFYKIIVDKCNTDTVYLCTQHDGIFISHDGGDYWSSWNEGLTNLVAGTNGNNVTNTLVLSADGLYLYFGTAGSGVFRRPTETNTATEPTIGYSPSNLNFIAAKGGFNPPAKAINIWNAGDGTLVWSVSDSLWLDLSPLNGTSTGETDTVTVSIDISGMSEGNYDANITIADSQASNSPQIMPVHLTINPPMQIVDEPSAAEGFASIAPFLETAYGFKTGEGSGGWTVYNPSWPSQANSLATLNIARGYWINVSDACMLQYGSQSYDLDAGWNLIGWLPQDTLPPYTEVDVVTGLESIQDALVVVYGYKSGEGVGGWTTYNPIWPAEANSLTTLYVARGYWISVSEPCTLQFGGNTYVLDQPGWWLIGWIPQQ